MRILITGVTGRIGANLAAALVRDGHQVRGLVWDKDNDRGIDKLNGYDVEFVSGSLTEPEQLRKAADGVEAVYHLGAAFQAGGPFKSEDYFEINARGTFNLLEAARAQDNLQHFFLASTDSVYKKSAPGGMKEPISVERNPPQPSGWYGLSKVLAEELVIGYFRSYGMPNTVVRFCNTQGAGEFFDYGAFWLSKMKDRPEVADLWGGEERLLVVRDFNGRAWKKHMGDVRDMVHGCVVGLGKETAHGQVFQLGGPSAFTWDTLVPYISEKTGVPYVEANLRGDPTYYEYDLSKPRKLLGFEPQYDAFRMIDDCIALKNGEDIGVLPT
jgi:UDP-glucose 4-epimerase